MSDKRPHESESPDDSGHYSKLPKTDEDVVRQVNGKWVIPPVTKAQSTEAKRFLKTQGMVAFLEKYLPELPMIKDLLQATVLLGFFPHSLIETTDLDDEKNVMKAVRVLQKAMNKTMYTRLRNPTLNTPESAIEAIKNAKKILVLTGAGISTSLGIPDFRSPKGLYSLVGDLELDDPQQVFDLETFRSDPDIFYQIAHMMLPPKGIWTPTHSFIKLLSDQGKLLRNYTQNIDNLEGEVGIPKEKFIQCHGSFATATCRTCKLKIAGEKIFDIVKNKKLPLCGRCKTRRNEKMERDEYVGDYGLLKPDITFFGEDLPTDFHDNVEQDARDCDLLICIGTSLKVAPVSNIVNMVKEDVPQILINKDDLSHAEFDVTFLGYCDEAVTYLCDRMGWELKHEKVEEIKKNGLTLMEVDADVGIYEVTAGKSS